MDSSYQNLANAIIAQAADDYRKARRVLFFYPHDRKAKREMTSILRFFRSDWFRVLSDLDPEVLIELLRKEDAV